MRVINRDSVLWRYLSEYARGLIMDGEMLLDQAERIPHNVSDYSYLVFPFAKAYEGFLKTLFLDLDLITESDYYGNEIRIGRILNPYFRDKDYSVYAKLCRHDSVTEEVPEQLWEAWKRGRNQVFHYFPHNFRKLTYEEARGIIKDMIDAMEDVVEKCHIEVSQEEVSTLVR